MAVHAIKNVVATTPRSRERQALAAAIEAVGEAERAEESGREAVRRAEHLVSDAETKLNAAVAAVAAAREQQARRVAEAVSAGSRATPAGAMKAARAAETESQDDLDAARAALEQLQESLADREAEAGRAAMQVEAEINAVLAAAAPRLVAAIAAHRTELLSLLSISYFISKRGSERHGSSGHFSPLPALQKPLAAVAAEIESALQVGAGGWSSDFALAHPILERWSAVVVALRSDADAPLPAEE